MIEVEAEVGVADRLDEPVVKVIHPVGLNLLEVKGRKHQDAPNSCLGGRLRQLGSVGQCEGARAHKQLFGSDLRVENGLEPIHAFLDRERKSLTGGAE